MIHPFQRQSPSRVSFLLQKKNLQSRGILRSYNSIQRSDSETIDKEGMTHGSASPIDETAPLGFSDDGIIRVKDAKRSIAARKAKEAEREEKRATREWKRKYGPPTTPRIDEAQMQAEAMPLYNEGGEVIVFIDKF
ncbi:hypothetical protein N7478_010055 [Penicillium angulare]|uniref:uncharacterized protein n=1 Tax=Penicillium angulare TaxID=116970 RepID=UPI00253F9BD4|nr:uncharacterized protein N7478_010055 [Penicillium angulare]KAJ5267247.1 hypothetical protein N7478_010055 [Penicillium angulare]